MEPSLDGPPRVDVEPLFDRHRGVSYVKPRWRGWLHLVCFEVALVVGTVMIVAAHGAWHTAVAAVYASAVAALFGASATYHRGNWSPRAMALLQRLDQMMIFVLIAGTASAPIALTMPRPWSIAALVILWTVTVAAILARSVWPTIPERLGGAIFLSLGLLSAVALPWVWMRGGVAPAVLLLAGGALYILGALSFHARRPDPLPPVFGYHEVFHAFVCLAAACQYVAIGCFLV